MVNPINKQKMDKADWLNIFGIFTFLMIMISENIVFCLGMAGVYLATFVILGNLHNIDCRHRYKVVIKSEGNRIGKYHT